MTSKPDEPNVVSLTGFMNAMHFAPISEVTAYWEALRAGRVVPLRSDIDPRGIEQSLSHAFVIERIAPHLARFRLAGTHLNDLMGMEVRGMPISAFFTKEGRDALGPVLERVFTDPCAAEMRLAAEAGYGKPPLETRLVLLPLRSDLGDISRALGCLVARGQIGRAPRRFAIATSRFLAVQAGRPLGDAAPPPPASPEVVGLAEDAAPFTPRRSSERPHLRLVKSD
jgi:hypothetical protein